MRLMLEREIWFRDTLPFGHPWALNGRYLLVLNALMAVRYIKPEAA
jgi:hypothetical protein